MFLGAHFTEFCGDDMQFCSWSQAKVTLDTPLAKGILYNSP